MVYRRNSTDRAMVRQIQQALGITADGVFGPKTEQAVIKFQSQNNLVADGVVGRKTLEVLGILDSSLDSVLAIKTSNGLNIIRHHLPENEYIKSETPILNEYLFLHHTAGWENPYKVIDDWGRDSRGKIATEFVIGGQNIRTGDAKYDGEVVQAFPEGCQGWHLGNTGSFYMNRHSVGIEVCNFGHLTDDLKTYVGTKALESQVVKLKEPFKTYTNWHKYSDAQLEALKKLIVHVGNRDKIDITTGLVEWIKKDGVQKAFDFQEKAFRGEIKGLLNHTNVRKDKNDCFPQDELVDMLLTL